MTAEQTAAYKDGLTDGADNQNHEGAYCWALVKYYNAGRATGTVRPRQHCTQPDQTFCDCDWCRYYRELIAAL